MEPGFIGLSRHRIGIDGRGVTTLVAFHGCPLRCRYCLNGEALRENGVWKHFSPQRLYEAVRRDDLYFVATGGGVTFGGGEPLLYPDFIIAFRKLCSRRWKINVESSLNVDNSVVRRLAQYVDHWIVDVKDMNSRIYVDYTGRDNGPVIDNLKTLVDARARVTARVPLIPGYNAPDDVERSVARLNEMGITDIDRFTYIVKSDKNE